jgi:eukaryotic-like serine/threonine-protein kinase
MMDNQQGARLITKSLQQTLSDEEQASLEEFLKSSSEGQAVSQLMATIDLAVERASGAATADEDSPENSAAELQLSELAKERMRRAIRRQMASASVSTPQAGYPLVAETTAYYHGPRGDEPQPVAEMRQTQCRFTLLRRIGQGGLGTVWLARDELLRRNVAIKEMNSNAAESPKLWRRFMREAEITGHLEHPNVVPLYLSGINAATGLPFYAMRFLGKQTLAEAISEYHARRQSAAAEPIHLHRLLNVFLHVCQAIAYAHSRGVIHRDLKPENVALDNFGQVLVLDWGLAKVEDDGELATRLALHEGSTMSDSGLLFSMDGDVLGTPLYMSPEQASGELDSLDQRTDIYGLGAILFSILTGVAPHADSAKGSDSSGRATAKQVLHHIATTATPRPRDYNPQIPRELEAICMRAMAKERYARHVSAEELSQEVENWIAGTHRRQAKYEAMRLTGRDLKSRLCVQIRQLAVTAQFMVELPPIQYLLAQAGQQGTDEFATWQERLSTILLSLARTKSTLTGLSFAQVADQRLHELVRVERSLQDATNIRGLPTSRLRHGTTSTFHQIVMQQFPGECCIDLDWTIAGSVRLVAGVPVFDSRTEEPFGLVLCEAEVGALMRPEIAATESNNCVYLMDDSERILFSTRGGLAGEQVSAADAIPRWREIADALDNTPEFIDADQEFYGSRYPLPQHLNSLRMLLRVAD